MYENRPLNVEQGIPNEGIQPESLKKKKSKGQERVEHVEGDNLISPFPQRRFGCQPPGSAGVE